ncbi:ankyrin repeat, PH and SEC7 domain containing protein secG-like [Artemia franciscana]
MERSLFCPICLNELKDSLRTLKCKYVFCGYCIKKWLLVKASVPMDRNAVVIKDLSPLYSYSDERPTSPIIENLLQCKGIYFHPNRIWNMGFSSGKPAKCSALHVAARKGNLEICQLLNSKGVTVDALDSENTTALHFAAFTGNLEICQLLVSKGATVDALDSKNRTALHFAAFNGNVEICQLLLSKGATVDALDFENWTALQIAASVGYLEICQLLVSKGATVDALDSENRTVLHVAASEGNLEICQLLVSKGVTVDALDLEQ